MRNIQRRSRNCTTSPTERAVAQRGAKDVRSDGRIRRETFIVFSVAHGGMLRGNIRRITDQTPADAGAVTSGDVCDVTP